jgi:hypothetical protein
MEADVANLANGGYVLIAARDPKVVASFISKFTYWNDVNVVPVVNVSEAVPLGRVYPSGTPTRAINVRALSRSVLGSRIFADRTADEGFRLIGSGLALVPPHRGLDRLNDGLPSTDARHAA